MRHVVEEPRRRIAEAGDPTRAVQMQAYMKSTMPFRGVTAVPLRKICREVFNVQRLTDEAAWRSAVLDLWDNAEYREERYAALALTEHRFYRDFQNESTLDLYLHLVTTGAWWDFVDVIASNRVGPILRTRFETVVPRIRSWAGDEDMWVRRAAILCQLRSKDATDVDLLRCAIEQNLEGSPFGKEFFIRKAIGWALREHAKTDESWVVDFVAHHPGLSALSGREALKNSLGSPDAPLRR